MSESHNHVQEDDCRGEHVEWLELGRIAFVGLAIAFTWFRLWQPLPYFDVVGFRGSLDRWLSDLS